jgi:hypothetical protein
MMVKKNIMKYFQESLIIITILLLLVSSISFIPASNALTMQFITINVSDVAPGLLLYSPMMSSTAYLIDENGNVNHTWSSSSYLPGCATYMIENETILRTARRSMSSFGGAGGGLQKITYDDTIIWDFTYDTSDVLSHHDIEPLPNGNVLMIAWEVKTRNEAIQAGRDPNSFQGSYMMPDHIIEVKQTGYSSGDIVWEWHAWDHLIQDYDPSKDNYGVVGDHPELIDINFGSSSTDWLHTNSIDYHEEFDQILLSIHSFNEVWVIDHSTTTEVAAGHTGGASGKGGDLLYRWGNPRAYDQGSYSDQKLYGQHDANWVKPGRPGEGNILVFNNGVMRPLGRYSSIDEIILPVDQNGVYSYTPGTAYAPENQVWIYTAETPTKFYGSILSGAERLPNGNTLICCGTGGEFFEVTPEKVTIWEYTNPFPNYITNNVFKVFYYLPEEQNPEIPDLDCEGSITWTEVKPGEVVEGIFSILNVGGNGSELDWIITELPNWGDWTVVPQTGEDLTPEEGSFTIQVTVVAPLNEEHEFTGIIKIENQDDPEDFDVIPITLITPLLKNGQNSMAQNMIAFFLNKLVSFYEKLQIILY